MKDPFSAAPPASAYLSHAVWRCDVWAVYEWLRKGQNIEQEAGGRTPVLWALSRGKKDMVDVLVQKGADLSRKTEDGDNALTCAVWGGNVRLVEMLLLKGFDPAEKGLGGKSALDWAEERNATDIITLIADATRDIEKMIDGQTPVLRAISFGHQHTMDLLIARGADIYKKTESGDNALICAVGGGNADIVRLLLDKGFDPSDRGSEGKNALDRAEECKASPEIKGMLAEAAHERTVVRQQRVRERIKMNPKMRLRL
jgi:ankyrin repeat protein